MRRVEQLGSWAYLKYREGERGMEVFLEGREGKVTLRIPPKSMFTAALQMKNLTEYELELEVEFKKDEQLIVIFTNLKLEEEKI